MTVKWLWTLHRLVNAVIVLICTAFIPHQDVCVLHSTDEVYGYKAINRISVVSTATRMMRHLITDEGPQHHTTTIDRATLLPAVSDVRAMLLWL